MKDEEEQDEKKKEMAEKMMQKQAEMLPGDQRKKRRKKVTILIVLLTQKTLIQNHFLQYQTILLLTDPATQAIVLRPRPQRQNGIQTTKQQILSHRKLLRQA